MTELVSYELMRLTGSDGVKVVLTGQGAAGSLAGYPSYFGDYWSGLLTRGRIAEAWGEIGRHAAAHGGSRPGTFARQLRRAVQFRLGETAGYRGLARWHRRRQRMSHRWYSRELTDHFPEEADAAARVGLNESLIHSIYSAPLPRFLRVEDRNSMAHSIESRLPFLDYRLVSLAFGLPLDWRLR